MCATTSAEPSEADFSPLAVLLERSIRQKAFPGCAAAVGTSNRVLWKQASGRLDYEDGPPVTTTTLFDLASLTKVVGTTSVVLALVRDGKLALGDSVEKHVSGFRGTGVTVEHLLTHSSGLPAWRPFHKEATSYAAVLEKVLAEPLESPPGIKETYSDLGFILLGEVASRAGRAGLSELERTLVFDPLDMRDTMRNPPQQEIHRIAPTEKRPRVVRSGSPGSAPAQQGLAAGAEPDALRGIVHDENAEAAEGITGHAGLFSTLDDLCILCRELLRARHGSSRVFPSSLLREFTTRRGLVRGSSRALGWDTPSPSSSAGSLLGPGSFGHTGFTGTSIWIDPQRDIYVILLSNRVYPTRDNLKVARVRREMADGAVLCLEGRLRCF